jgi:adenosylmethionine---8-amino-7-oxononanoate aminotransferase
VSERPNSAVWHPFAQHALQQVFPQIVRAEGAYLYTEDGRRIIDAISSWWVITHGHRHPRITAAIQSQAETLDQLIFAEYTHEPAERLATKLTALAPKGLQHVFYSDSGSTSVEVALKMALGYWRHSGEPRHRIIVLEGSYHGDTIGAMSVGARGIFTQTYDPLLFDVSSIPFPKAGSEEGTFSALEEICARSDTAALIVEPLVLGAGGMLMYPPWVLKRFRDICTTHEVLMIADEVMTGWGRTGTLFACEQAAIAPDIACYSKGLTGGALPLAVTLCTREIFMAHYAPDRRRTFFHSSSFTANPIACAAALANLEIWETDAVHARIAKLELMQAEFLGRFRGAAGIENVRQTGTITAFDLETPDAGYLSVLGPRLRACFQAANVLLRPLGNTIYVLPPYCVSREDLDRIYESIDEAITAC